MRNLSADLEETLNGIDEGTIALEIVKAPDFCNYPEYRAENGWRFCVFDDAGSWDYLEWAESPEGERIDYPCPEPEGGETQEHQLVLGYAPKNCETWGYCENCYGPLLQCERKCPPRKPYTGKASEFALIDEFFREDTLVGFLKKQKHEKV